MKKENSFPLYCLEDLKVTRGKVDVKDLVGAVELWIADLTNQVRFSKKISEETKNKIHVGIKVLSWFVGLEKTL